MLIPFLLRNHWTSTCRRSKFCTSLSIWIVCFQSFFAQTHGSASICRRTSLLVCWLSLGELENLGAVGLLWLMDLHLDFFPLNLTFFIHGLFRHHVTWVFNQANCCASWTWRLVSTVDFCATHCMNHLVVEVRTSSRQTCYPEISDTWCRVHAEGSLRKGVFLPSKHLLSAFYATPPPLRTSVPTETFTKHLLRTLLRSTGFQGHSEKPF